jgi:hypothetical protein
MGNLTGIKNGAEVDLMVKKEGQDLRVARDGVDCKVFTDYEGNISRGQRMTVQGTVSKAIYNTNNDLQMLFVEAESTELASPSERKDKLASRDTDASSRSSDHNSVSDTQSEATSRSTSSKSQSHPVSSSRRGDNKGDRTDSLDKIAEELIGDEEFEIEEDDDSLVGEAKRQARNQQRDPAIDPKLSSDR